MTNIVLIGFMGTGKTSVGMRLSDMLDMQFVDTDEIIESESGMTIPEIFSKMGEDYFRDLESDSVKKVSKFSRYIIATGGGAVMREQNLRNLKNTGMLFCLDAEPEVILSRTLSYNHRPLLQVEDPIKQIREMLKKREPFYAEADYRINTSLLTIDQVAELIAQVFCLSVS